MRIHEISLYHISMPLNFTFRTAKSVLSHRESLVIKVVCGNSSASSASYDAESISNKYSDNPQRECIAPHAKEWTGFGEVVSFTEPFYTAETLEMSKNILLEKYIPLVLAQEWEHPFDIHSHIDNTYPMAKAGLENALLDAYAKSKGKNIITALFNEELKDSIEVGIVLGDLEYEDLAQQVDSFAKDGVLRFKIKIKPDTATQSSFQKLAQLTRDFPQLTFLADANKSYHLGQIAELQKFDSLSLACIEDPFSFSHLSEIKDIQNKIKTPLCLDESIQNMDDLEQAYKLQALSMLNIKIGKLGGLFYTKQAIDFCRKNKIKYWIGSMLESGISKILHVQLAALSDTCMPGDLSDSKRYFKNDLIFPEIISQKENDNGKNIRTIKVPKKDGLGVEIDEEMLLRYCKESWVGVTG